jgi:hypothetical protein
MPVQRPFNKEVLWQGKIQRANYPSPHPKPQMILPEINSTIGGTITDPTAPQIWEEINQSYTKYSSFYWARVKQRQELYRDQQSYPNLPSSSLSSFSPYQRKQDWKPLRQSQTPTPHVSLEELVASPLDRFS